MKTVGYKIAYVDDINPLQSDFTTDVINMKNAGVNAVDLGGIDWQDAAIFVQNAATQNWHPGLIFSDGVGLRRPVHLPRRRPGGDRRDPDRPGLRPLPRPGRQERAGGKQFVTYVKKVNPSWVPDLYTLFGWASAELFVQALKAAGPHPTRGAVIAQLKKITSFDGERAHRPRGSRRQDAVGLLPDGQHQERQLRPRAAEGRRVRLQRRPSSPSPGSRS